MGKTIINPTHITKLISVINSDNYVLDELAIKFGTDKSSLHHNYCNIYEQYLLPIRNADFNFVEQGIGGYSYPDRGGESLRMWNEYFSKAEIHGFDIFPKTFFISNRVNLYCTDNAKEIIQDLLPFVIIDDGSHINAETIQNFKDSFPYLQSGGYYFVEDTHTSYWDENFYGNEVPGTDGTTMKFFTELTHQLNHETLLAEYRNEYAGQIEFIHFYKQLIVIKKK